MLAISCLRHRWGQKNRQLGQQTTHVEDCGLGHRTGVQFPAPPPIRFGGNKPLGFTKVRLSGFSYSRRFPRFHGIMWAKCGQKSSPRSPLPQRENGPDRQVGRLGLSRLRCRTGPNCAWWSCGEVEALFDGADADERAGEDAERVERGHYRVHVSPAPCGADRTDEQGECGQDDGPNHLRMS